MSNGIVCYQGDSKYSDDRYASGYSFPLFFKERHSQIIVEECVLFNSNSNIKT